MLYAKGNSTDDQLHHIYHKACLQGLSFPVSSPAPAAAQALGISSAAQ
jgi:hypothetical protein